MKKLCKEFLTVCLLLLILTSCSADTTSSNQDIATSEASVSETNEAVTAVPSTTTKQTDAQNTFEPSKNLSVVAAYVYNNDTYVVLENTGDKPILDYSVAFMNFDGNGFLTTTETGGYELGSDRAANLMPGTKCQGAWYGATGAYAVAVVTSIRYSDDTTWEATAIDEWVKEQKSNFSVESYQKSIESLEFSASLAESNEYITIDDLYIKQDNQFSSESDLHFQITNNSNQGVVKASLFILQYDENGFSVSVDPYDTYCKNGRTAGGTVNLAAGETSSYSSSLFAEATTTQLKAIVATVEFQDGTTWQNPYLYEWVLYNNKTY